MAEKLVVQRGIRKEMQNKKIPGKSERRILISQGPIDLLNRNFRHAQFIRHLRQVNEERRNEGDAGNGKG